MAIFEQPPEKVKQDKIFENDLLKSEKNNVEHNAVIDYIKKSVEDFVEKIDVQTEVFILKGRAICFVFERGMDD